MSDIIPRLRMFAGPNGSGKSTINRVIRPELLGVYVNPDEIEKSIRDQGGFLDLTQYEVLTSEAEILEFFQQSPLLEKSDLLREAALSNHAKVIWNFLPTSLRISKTCFVR